MDYEIMVKEVNELKNADLKKNTLKIINAQNSLKRNQWEIVNALGVILIEKQWADDFESQNKFGEYLGVTTGTMSQYKNAYRFVQLTNANCDKISVANAYLLSTFIKEEETVEGITSDFSEYLKFEKWCKENEIDFMSFSQKKLRETIKDFHKETAGETTSETTEQICNKLEICLNAIHELTTDELKELRKEINKLLK